MHSRVPSCTMNAMMPGEVENNSKTCHLPPFPPTQSIRDSTDELYLTVIHEPSSSDSSSGSSSPRGKSSKIKDAVKKATGGRTEHVETDIQALRGLGAGRRRSYFSSATKRRLIQFGPLVCKSRIQNG